MSEQQDNIQERHPGVAMPDEGDAVREQMKELQPYLLDAREDYPEPYYLLEYNGVPFSTLGGIQALSGQKKNGKTFLLAQLMAAVLGINSERVKTYLPGLRMPQRTLDYLGHMPTVLYVDTEMEKLNSAKVLRRVHWLCGWQMNVPCERFNVLWLRSVTDTKDAQGNIKERAYKKRHRLILQAIDALKPDAVFIDGLRDIIGDFNDNEESASLISELMAVAEERGICIWNTLHQNPKPRGGDEDGKMRGHLGTELGNKITDTLVCIKHKDKGQVWFTVKQDDARGKDMEDWEFVVTEAAGALGVPQMRAVASDQDITDAKVQQERIEANDIFKLYPYKSRGATWTDLSRFAASKGIKGSKFSNMLNCALDWGILYRTENKKYFYKDPKDIQPNDRPEVLPFEKPDGKQPDF